ncbi:MAG: hypothetical protein M1820_010737 [Bogoriella megaspora]|nr:MAG: hypothetical protein M1820_010737 [Bogoriella megaspora]
MLISFLIGVFVLLALANVVLNCTNRVRGMRKHGCKRPRKYPHKDPFFGLDVIFEDQRANKEGRHIAVLQERFHRCGKTYEQLRPDRARIINTMEAKMAQAVATQIDSFGFEPMRYGFPPTRAFFGRGILAVDGPFWEHSRALIKPVFAKAQIANLASLDNHLSSLMTYIPKNGSTVDLQPLFKRLFVDTGMEFIFGESAGTLEPTTEANPESFVQAFDEALILLGQRLTLGPLWFLASNKDAYKNAYTKVHKIIDGYVSRAMGRGADDVEKHVGNGDEDDGKRTYFLPLELGKVVKDPVELRYQLLQIFFPARDTIAIAVSNIFFFLARHSDVFAKLRTEIESIGSSPLTFELLKSMRYLRYVYNETLRLRGPTGQAFRTALHDCTLPLGGGPEGKSPVFLRKGDAVVVWMNCIHRDPDIWGSDAEEFKPERWETARPLWEFIPFFGGPRICPAQQMVFVQAAMTTVRLLQKFKAIENRDSEIQYLEVNKITTESKNGCQVSLIPV